MSSSGATLEPGSCPAFAQDDPKSYSLSWSGFQVPDLSVGTEYILFGWLEAVTGSIMHRGTDKALLSGGMDGNVRGLELQSSDLFMPW